MSAPVHDADSVRQSEIDVEQRYVNRVYARLAQLRHSVAEVEKGGYGLARVGNFGALVERDAMVFHAARRRHALDAEYEGLVFGRLDLGPQPAANGEYQSPTEPAVPGGEVRYIGRLGMRDEAHESLVVDWRAPAAAAVLPGDADRTDGRGPPPDDPQLGRDGPRRRGRPARPGRRRRTMMPVIGDGALMATLTRATGTGMRDIVATIQREQDEAIRSPASGVTIVRGGPGTGKTAVALHRAAYLLYADRNRFESGGVLVIGPSDVFVSYVSRVLPSLGEDTVTLRSLGQAVERVNATRHDPSSIAAIKGSLRMARVLARAARDTPPGGPDRLRVLYRGQLLELGRRQLEDARRAILAPGVKRNAVRAKAAGYLLDALWRQSMQLLPAERQQKREEFAPEIAERREFIQFMGGWWPILSPVQVLGWFADPALVRRYAEGILSPVNGAAGPLVPGFETDGPDGRRRGAARRAGRPAGQRHRCATGRSRDPYQVAEGVREVTTYADRMAAARAVVERGPTTTATTRTSSSTRRRTCRRCSGGWSGGGAGTRAGRSSVTRRRRPGRTRPRRRGRWTRRWRAQAPHEFELTTNYRNAAEIFELAAAVIRRAEPGIKLPTAVRTSGVPPRTGAVTPAGAPRRGRRPRELLGGGRGHGRGDRRDRPRRDEVAGWLAEAGEPSGCRSWAAWRPRAWSTTAWWSSSRAQIGGRGPAGVRTLYVALSRATQRLVTVSTDDSWEPDRAS